MTGVWAANVAPTAVATASPNPASAVTDVITLTGTASTDPAPGMIRSYLWEYVSGDRTGVIADAAAGVTTFTPAAAGITDSFNRADSTTTLGTADTGQVWTVHAGTGGIETNTGRNFAASTLVASVDFAATNMVTQVTTSTLPAGSNGTGVAGRLTDGSNFYLAQNQASAGAFEVYKCVGGTFTLLGSVSGGGANGDIVKLVTNGTAISGHRNGVSQVSVTDTAITTGNQAGIRMDAQASRVDVFSVAAP